MLVRVALLHTVPSDDLHRYVWEGKIQRYGLNPYTTVPLDITEPDLTANDPNWARINHPDYPAIYPPLAQLVFRVTSWFSDSVYVVKASMVLFELLAIGLLGKLLIALGRSPQWAALYALNPLAISAVAIDGHQDSLMLLALALACLTAQRNRWWWCGLWLGVAISTKTVALVLAPWLLFRRPIALLVTAFVIAICYIPFADAGLRVFDSLLRFGDTTTSLGWVVTTFEPLLGERPVRVVGALMLAAFAFGLASKKLDLPTFATRVFAALILVMPVVHAWYLTWMLFFSWARVRYAWLILCGAAFVYFEADGIRAQTGTWSMPAWVCPAWYAPFLVAWIVEFNQRRRAALNNSL